MLIGAILGFGNIIQANHIQAFFDDRFNNKITIKAVAEPNAENRKISEIKFPQIKFYSSVDDLLNNEKLDFVDIAAPPKFHATLLQNVIERKLNIICEKPFTLKLNEAKNIKNLLLNSGIKFAPCHQYKYLKIYSAFKSEIEEMDSGEKVMLRFNVYRTKADPGLSIFKNSWRTNPAIGGGGILTDTGVHYLYLSNWLLGKPLSVNATNLNLSHTEYNVEDTSLVTIEFEKGISQIALTWGGNRRFNSSELISKNLSLTYLGGDTFEKFSEDKTETFHVPNPSDKSIYTELYFSLFNDFLNNCENEVNTNYLVEEAYNSIKLLNSCYLSASEQRTIFL